MKSRSEFVKLAEKIKKGETPGSFAGLCRRYNVSRKNGYKWLARYEAEGVDGLKDRARTPHHQPKRSSDKIEQNVLELRDAHPAWGGRKLRKRLINLDQQDVPAASTITEILRRNDRLNPETAGKPNATIRFERKAPNDLWQMDFKGHFALSKGGRCHPFTVTDDHSRFNICLQACADETGDTVRIHLTDAFRMYGLPTQILSDNGAAWSCVNRRRAVNQLEAWLIRIGIDPIHGRPYHPQTQGKEERFHKTLKVEVLNTRPQWDDFEQCDTAFRNWRPVYNEQRPHEAIGDEVPISRYTVSQRSYKENSGQRDMREHYGDGEIMRKVDRVGTISYLGKQYYVGIGIIGEYVVIRAVDENHVSLSYGWKRLGKVELNIAKDERGHLKPFSTRDQ